MIAPQNPNAETPLLVQVRTRELYDGDVAVVHYDVRLADNTTFTVRAHSKRTPGDRPNKAIAMYLAHGRALQEVGRKLEEAGHELVVQMDERRAEKAKLILQRDRAKRLTRERQASQRAQAREREFDTESGNFKQPGDRVADNFRATGADLSRIRRRLKRLIRIAKAMGAEGTALAAEDLDISLNNFHSVLRREFGD